MADARADRWQGGDDYEAFVGRWSRPVARELVGWLELEAGRAWLDVGCGTGALSAAIVEHADPAVVVAVDRSPDFVAFAGSALHDPRVVLLVGDAAALPLASARADAVVSGLVLNFLDDPGAAVAEWRRVARPGGTIAAYVWDYAAGMQPIRAFWDAAIELDPSARALDEAVRFPLCDRTNLQQLFEDAGVRDVQVRELEVEARFRDLDDYWRPFLSGVGPAPGYCAALPADRREALRAHLAARLAPSGSGPLVMRARAFAVRGVA